MTNSASHYNRAWDLAERLFPDESRRALLACFRGDGRKYTPEDLKGVELLLYHLVKASEREDCDKVAVVSSPDGRYVFRSRAAVRGLPRDRGVFVAEAPFAEYTSQEGALLERIYSIMGE